MNTFVVQSSLSPLVCQTTLLSPTIFLPPSIHLAAGVYSFRVSASPRDLLNSTTTRHVTLAGLTCNIFTINHCICIMQRLPLITLAITSMATIFFERRIGRHITSYPHQHPTSSLSILTQRLKVTNRITGTFVFLNPPIHWQKSS